MLKRMMLLGAMLASVAFVTACGDTDASKRQQHRIAEQAAQSISFTDNAEIDNIKRRLQLTSKPGMLGYVVLLNESGQPVYYAAVKGKPTSGSKRLTRPMWLDRFTGPGISDTTQVVAAPSDEGTYGSSGEYVFFWTTSDQYIQWNGKYLYSDKPIRLTVQPLVIDLPQAASAAK